MTVLMEIFKGVFFFLTIIVGIIFTRGDVMFAASTLPVIKQILMPGYLIFCGIMLGYVISRMWIGYDDEREDKNKIMTTSFLIGCGLGLLLAIIYIAL